MEVCVHKKCHVCAVVVPFGSGELLVRMTADGATLTTTAEGTSQTQRYSHLTFTGSNGKHYPCGANKQPVIAENSQFPLTFQKRPMKDKMVPSDKGIDSGVMNLSVSTKMTFYVRVKKKKRKKK